jgi:hypothetical protein
MCRLNYPRCIANNPFGQLLFDSIGLVAAIVDILEMLDQIGIDGIVNQCYCSSRTKP